MTATVQSRVAGLAELAALYGVQTAFVDVSRKRRTASPDSLIAVLRVLGAPVDGPGDVAAALAQRRAELAGRLIEPVAVAWDGRGAIDVRAHHTVASAHLELTLEDGTSRRWAADLSRARAQRNGAGPDHVTRRVPLRGRLPAGYHRLSVQAGKQRAECLVISAPARAYTGQPGEGRAWGVFLPLYALHDSRTWGAGDLTALGDLAEWVGEQGGGAVSTLPLLAAFLDEPFQPSPYSPASKLFWNEFYLDVEAAPEFQACDDAQKSVASAQFRRELADLRKHSEVSYKRGMALKRRVLEAMAAQCFADSRKRLQQLRDFVKLRPAADDYARFRATTERRREPWGAWPERQRAGRLNGDDYDEAARRYHLYVQFLAHEQMQALQARASGAGVRPYFDLPLGVSSDGYDVWRERDAFATGLSGGAPPDSFFTAGQDWGFPPAHPENVRKQGYRYLRATLANILRYAGVLRIDHVPGLHRLYCVPAGMPATQGAYVRYEADELYAVLSLESHRHRALIVGEDLGTVPDYVHAGMSRHALHRTYVVQYEASPGSKDPLPEPRRLSVASLNTHDMPPFAAWWQGLDTDDRLALGLMDAEQAAEERRSMERARKTLVAELRRRRLLKRPGASPEDVMRALTVALGRSRARLALVNLEDAWGETSPQNVPGTTEERVNWRRKARLSLEEIQTSPAVAGVLRAMDRARREKRRVK